MLELLRYEIVFEATSNIKTISNAPATQIVVSYSWLTPQNMYFPEGTTLHNVTEED